MWTTITILVLIALITAFWFGIDRYRLHHSKSNK